jgi:hypothetical protein
MAPLNVSEPTFDMITLIPSKLTDEVVSRYKEPAAGISTP